MATRFQVCLLWDPQNGCVPFGVSFAANKKTGSPPTKTTPNLLVFPMALQCVHLFALRSSTCQGFGVYLSAWLTCASLGPLGT